ncbi:hypothetical protein [Herbidospora cretacea]|uniref:hypothetical protein n=1 Tax=Herbidospora cretacea TaxID=28444 RepID=UPI0007C6A167|nr:hypothetical protein [Herbidospora cretacea]
MRKVLPVALAAALTVTTVSVPAQAAAIRVQLAYSELVPEFMSEFTCPTNMVLTGREHYGDEGAWTTYHCSFVFINEEQAMVGLEPWSSSQKESKSSYTAPPGRVLAGRAHQGDENGQTRYRPASLWWRGQQVTVYTQGWSAGFKESKHTFHAPANHVMIGRSHSGDENGTTRYLTAVLYAEG